MTEPRIPAGFQQHAIARDLGLPDTSILPVPGGSTQIVQHQTYLKQQAEVVLKQCLQQLREGALTWGYAACALGRIAGYYDLLSEIEREKRRLEDQRAQ